VTFTNGRGCFDGEAMANPRRLKIDSNGRAEQKLTIEARFEETACA
jgi:hypothetical protein